MKKLFAKIKWNWPFGVGLIVLFLYNLFLTAMWEYVDPTWFVYTSVGLGLLIILYIALAIKNAKNTAGIVCFVIGLPVVTFPQDTISTGSQVGDLILGDIPGAVWLGALFFAILGILLNLAFGVMFRDKEKPNSPTKFSLDYFYHDNKKRFWYGIFASMVVIFLTFRFFTKWTGLTLGMEGAFFIGFGLDYLMDAIKNRNFGVIGKLVSRK